MLSQQQPCMGAVQFDFPPPNLNTQAGNAKEQRCSLGHRQPFHPA